MTYGHALAQEPLPQDFIKFIILIGPSFSAHHYHMQSYSLSGEDVLKININLNLKLNPLMVGRGVMKFSFPYKFGKDCPNCFWELLNDDSQSTQTKRDS